MKLHKIFQFLFIFLFIFSSCNFGDNQNNKIGELDFGEVNPGKVIEKTFTVEFNPAAQNDKSAFLEFEFVDKSGQAINGIKFKLGARVINNKFRISPKDVDPNGKLNVGIIFPAGSKEQDYLGYLMLTDASNDLKQNISLNDTANVVNLNNKIADFHATYNVPLPTWELYSIYFLIFLLSSFLIWLVIIRNKIYPPMTGTINTPEGAIKLNGFRSFYIYGGQIPKNAQQGMISSIFTGKIGKKSTMSLTDDGISCFILLSTQSTPKGIRNRLSLSDNSLTIFKGQNVLYDQCDYVISKANSKTKFEFIYSNIKHKQTI